MRTKKWLIWRFETGEWWRPLSCGYTRDIKEAGRYSFEEASDIVARANTVMHNVDPNEAMIPEPESLEKYFSEIQQTQNENG